VTLIVTGLSRGTARFQARSALSGVGFTTSEAEAMLSHPVRRRVVMFLMLFGSAGIVTLVASLIISFTTTTDGRDAFLRSLTLVAGLSVVLLVARNPWIDRKLTRIIAGSLSRYTRIDARGYAALLNLTDGFTVAELHVDADDWIACRTLAELDLCGEGVAVLGLQRGSRDAYVGVPIGESPVLPGDTMVVYGQVSRIAELDERKAGAAGDQAHELAVTEHLESDRLESTRDATEMMGHDEMRRP
jgi:hypothetical protein